VKALEFQARINKDRTLAIPDSIAAQIPVEETVRVLLLVPEISEEEEWKRLAANEFFRGYAESDAIYDQLSACSGQ
jgi:hypothetical protein